MQQPCREMEAIRFELTDFPKLAADAIEAALLLSELDGCSIQLTCKGNPTDAWVVPDTITNMLINLLINAAEAKPGGMIGLRIFCEIEQLAIEVHDQGPGVAQHEVKRIFRPRYSTKKYHVGLGLLAVKAAVEIHDGRISVSKSDLGGACFQVQLTAR